MRPNLRFLPHPLLTAQFQMMISWFCCWLPQVQVSIIPPSKVVVGKREDGNPGWGMSWLFSQLKFSSLGSLSVWACLKMGFSLGLCELYFLNKYKVWPLLCYQKRNVGFSHQDEAKCTYFSHTAIYLYSGFAAHSSSIKSSYFSSKKIPFATIETLSD